MNFYYIALILLAFVGFMGGALALTARQIHKIEEESRKETSADIVGDEQKHYLQLYKIIDDLYSELAETNIHERRKPQQDAPYHESAEKYYGSEFGSKFVTSMPNIEVGDLITSRPPLSSSWGRETRTRQKRYLTGREDG